MSKAKEWASQQPKCGIEWGNGAMTFSAEEDGFGANMYLNGEYYDRVPVEALVSLARQIQDIFGEP